MIKRKTCTEKNCTNFIWKQGFCQRHLPFSNKGLTKTKRLNKISAQGIIKKIEKTANTKLQFKLFEEIYKEHPTKTCFECNKSVNGQSSAQFHHLLFKSQYPEYRLEKWNIVLVCENCHSQAHTNIDKTPKIKEETSKVRQSMI